MNKLFEMDVPPWTVPRFKKRVKEQHKVSDASDIRQLMFDSTSNKPETLGPPSLIKYIPPPVVKNKRLQYSYCETPSQHVEFLHKRLKDSLEEEMRAFEGFKLTDLTPVYVKKKRRIPWNTFTVDDVDHLKKRRLFKMLCYIILKMSMEICTWIYQKPNDLFVARCQKKILTLIPN